MRSSGLKTLFVWVLAMGIIPSLANSETVIGSPKASYKVSPLSLTGGSKLVLVSPNEWYPLAKKLSAYLEETHDQFAKIYGEIPPFETTLRLVEADTFFNETGAPTWTNAMYYNRQISLPLRTGQTIEMEDLYRSIRHEYTHAVVNNLSAGRCPGWLDEGLAQWAEGSINPALEPSLRKWLYFNEPIPLEFLQGGFTKLESKMVPPAYAQSLFAAKTIIHSFGFTDIKSYFKALRDGEVKSDAFRTSFRVSEGAFESSLGASLKNWAYGSHAHHHEHTSDPNSAF